MPKFGLFQDAEMAPRQEIEGDYMTQKGDHVSVFVRETKDRGIRDRQVGAFKLEKGQCVKEIK
jgi:hypothetical protein